MSTPQATATATATSTSVALLCTDTDQQAKLHVLRGTGAARDVNRIQTQKVGVKSKFNFGINAYL